MRHLLNLIPVLMILALVAVQGPGALPSGGGCVTVAQAEICLDPANRAAAGSTVAEPQGKACCDMAAPADVPARAADPLRVFAADPALWPGAPLAHAPWKPPRHLV